MEEVDTDLLTNTQLINKLDYIKSKDKNLSLYDLDADVLTYNIDRIKLLNLIYNHLDKSKIINSNILHKIKKFNTVQHISDIDKYSPKSKDNIIFLNIYDLSLYIINSNEFGQRDKNIYLDNLHKSILYKSYPEIKKLNKYNHKYKDISNNINDKLYFNVSIILILLIVALIFYFFFEGASKYVGTAFFGVFCILYIMHMISNITLKYHYKYNFEKILDMNQVNDFLRELNSYSSI